MVKIVPMVQDILHYLKNPDALEGENVFSTQKLKLFWTSFWMIMVCNLVFSILIFGVDELGLVNTDNHAVMDMIKEQSVLFIIGAAVIIAPLFEELIFRAPLTLFSNFSSHYFRWIFYLFAFAFGAVHISNYGVTTTTLLLLPILTAPQIVAGLFLGLIRVKVGLLYAMLFHAMYNGILTIPYIIYFKYFEAL